MDDEFKKKKKKTGFNLDTINPDGVAPEAEAPPVQEEDEVREANADVMEMFGKKKSKKKKKQFNMDELSENLPDVDEVGTSASTRSTGGDEVSGVPPSVDDLDLDMDFSKSKKKKKKGKKADLDDLLAQDENVADFAEKENEHGESWFESDRDYTYDELLQRAFTLHRERNPDMATGEKKKFFMKPPQITRAGTKKTAFINFSEICKLLHRLPKHVLQFLLAELGTSGSIDGNEQLIIRGRFQQKQIENILRRYIKEYVTCHTCHSPDTTLQRDARLFFLQCEQCNSRCSVAAIKSGFQAVANKQQRQKIRANKNE